MEDSTSMPTKGGSITAPGASETAKYGPGVVLGKDGKPCRSCTTWKEWAGMNKKKLQAGGASASVGVAGTVREVGGVDAGKNTRTTSEVHKVGEFTARGTSVSPVLAEGVTGGIPDGCPPDVETLGRSTWTFLHALTASYPAQATESQQKDMATFLGIFSRIYPCWVCAEDFQVWMARPENRLMGTGPTSRFLSTRDGFGKWMCRAHNEVNRKLGKGEFDCERWEERWRTGWEDGRCD